MRLLINSYWTDKAGKRYILNLRWSKGWIYILTQQNTEDFKRLEFTEQKFHELKQSGRLSFDGWVDGKKIVLRA